MIYLTAAKEACQAALEEPALKGVTDQLAGSTIDAVAELLKVTIQPESSRHIGTLAASLGLEPQTLARWLLIRTALKAMPEISSWKVSEPVKRFWAEDVAFYANPTGDLSIFSPSHVRFQEMARIVTLRRYPAGQFHWEISAFPRSYAVRTPISLWPKLFSTVCLKLHGFGPVAEIHVNDRRRNRLTLTESEGCLSYYRMAKSLELRPEIKGMFTCSWLYCASTAQVTPRLAWLRELFSKNGAFIGSIGPAPPDSGFLTGSKERRELYEAGQYHPLMTYVLWPRQAILGWALQSPEWSAGA